MRIILTWGDICDLGGGLIYDVLVGVLWYDSNAQDWVVASGEDEVKPLTALCIYVDGNSQIGFIFDRWFTPQPPKLGLDYDWNLVSLAISPTDWDSMPVNEAMVSVEQVYDIRGYTVVVSPEQRVDYKEEYRYQDTKGREYGFGGYDWYFEQSPWVYTVVSDDIPEMSIGGGYWVFMQEQGFLAGFSTTPVTRVFRDEPGHEIPMVPRYNWERVTRTDYKEYPYEDHSKIYLTYSGDVSSSEVFKFYKETMRERGWTLTAEEGSEDSASLDFTRVMGDAHASCHIDVVGGESIDILFELWEPGADLPDVPRYEWDPVTRTAYSQTTDSTGTHTNINYEYYEDRTGPEEIYKFYQERMEWQGEWEKIGEECHGDWAALMFRRAVEETRYMCFIWIENGVIEIEHHQFAASVPEEYLNGLTSVWWHRIEMRKWQPPEEPEQPQPPG